MLHSISLIHDLVASSGHGHRQLGFPPGDDTDNHASIVAQVSLRDALDVTRTYGFISGQILVEVIGIAGTDKIIVELIRFAPEVFEAIQKARLEAIDCTLHFAL